MINKLKILWASLFIPNNSPYCHHNFKKSKKHGICAYPCKYWTKKYDKEWEYEREYCKFMKCFLSLDDQIKDCGINDYEPKEEDFQ
jgi:hypothetical protein